MNRIAPRWAARFVVDTTTGAITSRANGRFETTMPVLYEVIGMLTVRGNSSNPGVAQSFFYIFTLDYSNRSAIYPTIAG
jgi:hypothetical protein